MLLGIWIPLHIMTTKVRRPKEENGKEQSEQKEMTERHAQGRTDERKCESCYV